MDKEIIWNLVNSGLAGGLVFFGACMSGNINSAAIIAAIASAFIVALSQFKEYWMNEKPEDNHKRIGAFL
jgi:hypothetical protein